MYWVLSVKYLELEYLDEVITVTYMDDMYFKLSGYEINNFVIIILNLFPDIQIDHFIMDKLQIQFDDDENLLVGDDFVLDSKYLDDLITLFKQSEAYRNALVRPNVASDG
ncbi:MAG: hypothetical protein GY707_05520 [Desulfobacteraceae bacterium]|nr:hypothetical protein [Desulfobacteraceae bacterium]